MKKRAPEPCASARRCLLRPLIIIQHKENTAGDAGPVTGGGGLRVSKLGKLQDKGKLGKFHVYSEWSCMLVIVAPPIVVGAWSIAFLLRQHVEY